MFGQVGYEMGFEFRDWFRPSECRELQSLGAEQLKALSPMVVSREVGIDRRSAEDECRECGGTSDTFQSWKGFQRRVRKKQTASKFSSVSIWH